MELVGATAGAGIRLASGAFQPLIRRLFRANAAAPGAGLVDRPVRVTALVSFRGEQRALAEQELRRLSNELVRRAAHAVGPHDAPAADELTATADLLCRSLLRLGELDMDDVQAVRLGHEELARRLALPQGDTGAGTFYPRLLEAACLHVLNFFTQRSTFVARTLVEQSRRLDQLAARLDLLVERVPHRSAPDTAFEARYAAYVEDEHGTLTIYGLDLNQEREWPLDDAYLSLETRAARAEHAERGERGERGEDGNAPPQRAERALAGQERVLLRGLAGSGKTTLVQWLAVTTARQNPGDGMTHLLGRVPFVLPMRTLTRDGAQPPTPDRFLAATGCPLAAAQPDGWADRVLAARRGLLLVDGIDEIPEAERDGVRRWLRRLNATYPGNLWLVTARPSAVRDDWLGREAFADLTLAPMGSADVQAFVHRWHRAAEVPDPAVESALLDLIRTRTDLAALAASPLMCAMICALHRERNGHLPHGRKALYDAALAMLLERRDRERPDHIRAPLELDADTQLSLLQKLAYWLINNGRSEMTHAVAEAQLAQALPFIHRGNALGPPATVLRHLVERSGLLREPAAGAIDFVHRTFQDYLGAREIVEWQHFPALIARAHEDQWEDVVRMAVAHAQPPQRAELLTALLDRGDGEPDHRVRLHLLATACLEQAAQLRPDVRERVETAAAAFLPPRTYEEAQTLANAGPFVLELLPGPRDGLPDDVAYAVVQTVARLGSDAALTRLRAFRDHPLLGVRHTMSASWSRFDTHRYFEEIISLLRHDGALWHFTATTPEELALLGTLDGLTRVNLEGDFDADAIVTALAGHPLTFLRIDPDGPLLDLSFLRRFGALRELTLSGGAVHADLTPLAHLPLRELGLYPDAFGEGSWRGLGELSSLTSFLLGAYAQLPSLAALPACAPLETLRLHGTVPRLTGLAAWPSLRTLALPERRLAADECREVAELPRLTSLTLHPQSLTGLVANGVCLPRVTAADLTDSLEADDLDRLATALPGLTRLHLSRTAEDLSPLAALADLRTLVLRRHVATHNAPPHVEIDCPPASRY